MSDGPIFQLIRAIWSRVWPALFGIGVALVVAAAVRDRRAEPGYVSTSRGTHSATRGADVTVPELTPHGRTRLHTAPTEEEAPVALAREPESTAARIARFPGLCAGKIESIPPGAVVTLEGTALGTTPLGQVPLPCGRTTVTLMHPRYRAVETTLVATPRRPAQFSARLERPVVGLRLASVPQGAQFKVNGKPACQAPCAVDVNQYESVQVEATLPGQRAWRRAFYVALPQMQLSADFANIASLGAAP